MRNIILLISFLSMAVLGAEPASGQTAYDFDRQLKEYKDSLSAGKDSVLFAKAVNRTENAIAMTQFVHHPKPLVKKKFGRNDFFLYLPLAEGAWHKTQFDGVYYYAEEDIPDTLKLPKRDSLECFALISGNEKYFSSKDMYGMGGYDLYKAELDENTGQWKAAENLGFPYSSPANDLLFINTRDGNHSILVSDRNCGQDSVYVFVLQYDADPVSYDAGSPEELCRIASLEPEQVKPIKQETPDTALFKMSRKYIASMQRIAALKDSLDLQERQLDNKRTELEKAETALRDKIISEIESAEQTIMAITGRINQESSDLQDIEMELVSKGKMDEVQKLLETAEKAKEKKGEGFTFTKKKLGKPITLKYVW